MPSEKVLQVKQNYVAELAEKLKKSACGVLVDYSGITVADDTVLRKELREAGVDYLRTLVRRKGRRPIIPSGYVQKISACP